MKRFIFILAMMFLLLSCKKSEAQLDFVTEYWLAQNFTPKSGVTPGTENTLWMDCDQIIARYQVTISGTISTGHRLPSKNQISSSVVYVQCGEIIHKLSEESGTITYTYDVDFGATSGLTVLNYQNYTSPDKIDIYQNGTLKASTGDYVSEGSYIGNYPVSYGSTSLPTLRFKYDVTNGRYGQIKVTTQSINKVYDMFFDCTQVCSTYTTYTSTNKNYSYLYSVGAGSYTLGISQSGKTREISYTITKSTYPFVVTQGTVSSFPGYVNFAIDGTANLYIDISGYFQPNTSTTNNLTLYGCSSTPTTSISSISNIAPESASVTYTASSDCPIARAICYSSTNTNPTTSDSHTSYTNEKGSSTVQLTGLTPSTTYYIRSVANNGKGTTYSSATSFTTSAAQPYTGIIDLSVTYQEDPQYYDVTFTATSQSTVQMNTTVYLAYIDPDYGGSIYNTVVIPAGSTSASVIVRYYRNAQYDVSCDFDSNYSVDFTYGTHPVYVTIPAL